MTYVGLDVHARSTHAAAIDVESGELRRARFGGGSGEVIEWLQTLPLPLRGCYEAGPTGYGLYRAAAAVGLELAVVVPSKTPRAPGDRARLSRLPGRRRRPRCAQAGTRRAALAARVRRRLVADRRPAALLPRHRHLDCLRARTRDRRLPPIRPTGEADRLARPRAL